MGDLGNAAIDLDAAAGGASRRIRVRRARFISCIVNTGADWSAIK